MTWFKLLERFPMAMTVEAHTLNGGAGRWVAEVIAEHGLRCKTDALRHPARRPTGYAAARRSCWIGMALTAERLAAKAFELLRRKASSIRKIREWILRDPMAEKIAPQRQAPAGKLSAIIACYRDPRETSFRSRLKDGRRDRDNRQ